MKQQINEVKKMKKLAGILKEALVNDDLIYNRMLGMDQEQLVSSILSSAEANPEIKLADYLNNEWGYSEED